MFQEDITVSVYVLLLYLAVFYHYRLEIRVKRYEEGKGIFL